MSGAAETTTRHEITFSYDELLITLAIVGKHCFRTGLLPPEDMDRFAMQFGALPMADRDMYEELRAVMWRMLDAAKHAAEQG